MRENLVKGQNVCLDGRRVLEANSNRHRKPERQPRAWVRKEHLGQTPPPFCPDAP